jgi:hypothetical protein
MTNNAMVVDNSTIVAINQLLLTGFAGSAWTGAGITSSSAAAVAATNPPKGRTGIGYARANDPSIPPIVTWFGQAVTPNSIVTRYTLAGDADLSGTVDTIDFNLLAANFNQNNTDWVRGNFNYDTGVTTTDAVDFGYLTSNFSLSYPGPPALANPVPEPCIPVLLALAPLAVMRRRRK